MAANGEERGLKLTLPNKTSARLSVPISIRVKGYQFRHIKSYRPICHPGKGCRPTWTPPIVRGLSAINWFINGYGGLIKVDTFFNISRNSRLPKVDTFLNDEKKYLIGVQNNIEKVNI